MYWLSAFLIVFGVLILINGGTPLAYLLGIGMVIAGGVIFWKNSATKRYLDSQKDKENN